MKQQVDLKKAQTTVEFLLGPIKIKDGLFLGDQLAAKDIEFIISNKVTHIINTVSKSVPNLYQRFGVQYLSVHWTQKQQNIFDKKNNAVNAIFQFVEQAMQLGQSCLIHSLHGKSRSTAVLVAYLMKKYGWTLNKCLELINSKKEGLEIRNNYLKQMQELEKKIMENKQLSSNWTDSKNDDDLLLANTFFNSKKPDPCAPGLKKSCRKKVCWDQKLVHKQSVNMSSTMTRFKQQQQPVRRAGSIRSILKGFPNPGEQQQQFEQTPIKKQFKIQGDDKLINNINGNIVHVTVNNFITTQKKTSTSAAKVYNARPYSSDTKDRQKKPVYQNKNNKMFGYDTFSSNLKNAYQQKIIGKVGNTALSTPATKNVKKKEEKIFVAGDRPNSANTSEEIKKPKPLPFGAVIGKQEMMVTGSSGMQGVGVPSSSNPAKRRMASGAKPDPRLK